MPFARGKYAKAISDRSGMEFPYSEMVKEWNGMLVHRSEYESKHPQLSPRPRGGDFQGLKDARTAREENEVARMLEPNPFETIAASSGIINVYEKSHGRSTSDTVRFRDVTGHIFGASVTEIEDEDGYSITKTDDDFYTFTVSTAAGITGNGGGGYVSAGPATLSA